MWLSLLSVVMVVLHSLGPPLGEPLMDDFIFMRRSLLDHGLSLFDGGGVRVYWRPLGRQLYFDLFSNLILAAPGLVVAFHVVAVSLTVLLLYRVGRAFWPAPWAAAAASFFPLAESTRMLVAWPSHFQDVGAMLAIAIALHEAVRQRMATAMLAILASLLFKEVAVLAALLIPWVAAAGPAGRGRRGLWFLATAATIAAWVAAYVVVMKVGAVGLPRDYYARTSATPWPTRFGWAIGESLRAQFSLAADRGPWDVWVIGAALALVAIALTRVAMLPAPRMRARLPTVVWGTAWFVAGVLPLTEVYPDWAPYRALLGGAGLGVALVALMGAASPWLLGGLVALRVVGFELSPAPPRAITDVPSDVGASFDFPRLARLERFVRETRTRLQQAHPTLPPGSRVVQHHLPQLTEYALSGDMALQVWYRDSTLRWVRFEEFRRHPDLPAATIVEYQSHRDGRIALVSPAAMRALFEAVERSNHGAWAEALAELHRADSLQTDRDAAVFLASLGAKRAWILSALGDSAAAEREAFGAYALWPDNPDSRFVIASRRFHQGRLAEAEALLDTLLARDPNDAGGLALLQAIRATQLDRPR